MNKNNKKIETERLLNINLFEILKKNPTIRNILEGYGLECHGCTFSKRVSLKEALEGKNISVEEFIKNHQEFFLHITD